MLHKLYLLRHAKSDWSVPGQKDIDRVLSTRGLNDTPRIGRKLYDMELMPDLIICSSSQRTRQTAELICEQLKFDQETIVFNQDIYEASMRTLFNTISAIDSQYKSVMMIGHNPGFTYLAEYLTNEIIDNMPTCSVVCIEFDINSWEEVSGGLGTLKWFVRP
jgi:phosphohistidine phosphatase